MLKNIVWRAADLLCVAGILCLAAYGVFCLPYAFPPKAVTHSLSFDAGFNNSVSVLAVLVAIARWGVADRLRMPWMLWSPLRPAPAAIAFRRCPS